MRSKVVKLLAVHEIALSNNKSISVRVKEAFGQQVRLVLRGFRYMYKNEQGSDNHLVLR